MALHDALACQYGDFMAGFHGDLRIHFQMCIDHDHVAHFAGMHIMYAKHARGVAQSGADGFDFFIVGGALFSKVDIREGIAQAGNQVPDIV